MNQKQDLLTTIEAELAEILDEAKLNHETNRAEFTALDISFRKAVKRASPDLAATIKAATSFSNKRGYAKGFLEASLRIHTMLRRWRMEHPSTPQEQNH